jgi:hypothetical protein
VHALDPTVTTTTARTERPYQSDDDDVTDNDGNGNGNEDGDGGEDVHTTTATFLPAGCFLIGNHADELTPWMPLLATRVLASGYLSIPCCAWSLDARFDRAQDLPFCAVDPETLNLGAAGPATATSAVVTGEEGAGKSSYTLYRVWLASLSVYCGWAVEVEVLRIPSTRNWAIVGELLLLVNPPIPFLVWEIAPGFPL